MTASPLPWPLYSERFTGHGHPNANASGPSARPDVINRAVREILARSGYDPDGSFPGLTAPEFNPMGFGAKGTGLVDDSAALAACDQAAAALRGTVALPAGTFLADGLSPTATRWRGTGRAATRIKHLPGAASGAAMLSVAGDLVLSGLTLDGNRANQTNRTRTVTFTGTGGVSLACSRVRFTGSSTNALRLDSVSGTVALDQCDFDDVGASLGTAAGDESNAIFGWHLTTGRFLLTNSRFVNGAPSDVTQAPCAVLLTGNATSSTFAVAVRGCHFENFGSVVNSSGVIDVYEYCSQVDISHNTIRKPHYTGVKASNSHAITVIGNTVADVTSAFTAPLVQVSLNVRSRGAAWSSAAITGNIVRNATAHRGSAYDFTSDQSPSAGAPWVIADNIADQVYGGMRLYGLQDAALTGNIIRGATSTSESFPALLVQQCSGTINWVGGVIAGGATVGVRVNDVMTNARLLFTGTAFRSNTTAHVKVDDTIGSTTLASLQIRGCDFTGGISPLSVNRATRVVLLDNESDSPTLTLTTVGTVRQEGNSWQPSRTSGVGSPEGVVPAVVGATYQRTDGGAGTSLYVKESGSGATGWVAK